MIAALTVTHNLRLEAEKSCHPVTVGSMGTMGAPKYVQYEDRTSLRTPFWLN